MLLIDGDVLTIDKERWIKTPPLSTLSGIGIERRLNCLGQSLGQKAFKPEMGENTAFKDPKSCRRS